MTTESNEEFLARMKEIIWDDFQPEMARLIALAECFVAVEAHGLDVFSYTDKWEVQDGETGHGASNNADLSTAIRQCVEKIEGGNG